jgi:heat shock protein HslJ
VIAGGGRGVLVRTVRRHESPGVRLAHRLGTSAAVLLLAGCAGGAGAQPDVAGEWELVQFSRDGAVVPAPVGGRATLTVADGQLSGTSFCNSYSGSYRLDGDALTVSELGGTEIGCAADLMDAEAAYLAALGSADQAATADGYLVLSGDDAELRFRPVPEVSASELTGTRWILETLLDGDVASSTTGLPAVLELVDDGTFTASTGCRDLAGGWSLDGDVVRVTDVTPDEATCDRDVAAQDQQVTAVLSDDFQAAVTEDSLAVTGAGGLGLVYRASG